MTKRIDYLDMIKGIAIFLVVWGHCIQYLGVSDFWHNPIFVFIYSFHMPLFMVISGFFFTSSLRLTFPELLKSKSGQLIMPSILLIFVMSLILNYLKDIQSVKLISNVVLDLVNSLWFLKALFVNYVIAYILTKYIKNKFLACFFALVLSLILPSPFNLRFMLPFFWVGIFFREYHYIEEKNIKPLLLLCCFVFIICLFFWKSDYTIYKNDFRLFSYFPFRVDIHNLGIMIFRFITGLFGSFLIIFGCKFLHSQKKIPVLFAELGKITLEVYILQFFLLEFGLSKVLNFDTDFYTYNFLIIPFFTLVIILTCSLLTLLIKKTKVPKYLLFGFK